MTLMSMIMKKWKVRLMNKSLIISNMVEFIEEKERLLQSSKTATESSIKNDIVKAILDELERETSNED